MNSIDYYYYSFCYASDSKDQGLKTKVKTKLAGSIETVNVPLKATEL